MGGGRIGQPDNDADDQQTTGHYYNFTNIRFAAPPTGQNRFRPPQPPARNRETVQDGSEGRICPASSPSWFTFNREWTPAYLEGEGFNGTMQQLNAINSTIPERAADPRTNEDCLFLDVLVPEKIYDLKDIARNFTPAPVLVWIYGKQGARNANRCIGLHRSSQVVATLLAIRTLTIQAG